MNTIRKLPAILSLGAGVLTGFASMASDIPVRDRMARMAIAIAIFWIVGLFARQTAFGVLDSVVAKREADRREAEEIARLEAEKAEKERKAQKKGAGIDLTTPDTDGSGSDAADFNPIPVSEFIRRELGDK